MPDSGNCSAPAEYPKAVGALQVNLKLDCVIRLMHEDWAADSSHLLPFLCAGTVWRSNRPPLPTDPGQGWKLHISATIFSARNILTRISPLLAEEDVLFKAPITLTELMKINSGIYYGYHQVGKIFTIYPESAEQAVYLAEQLHRLTLPYHQAPNIPYDEKYETQSCIYFRYGSNRLVIDKIHNTTGSFIENAEGQLIPDLRDSSLPEDQHNPFHKNFENKERAANTPLKSKFKALKALSQRGKSGVFMALDFSREKPRLCLLKEGRRYGEVEWDGRDGFWRVEHEREVLEQLSAAGVQVPKVYDAFQAESNFYLVTEYLKGTNFLVFLNVRKRKLPFSSALRYGRQIANYIAQIHSAGWIWRDCKPANLIMYKNRLRPVDFEGACRAAQPDVLPWGTFTFMSPEWQQKSTAAAAFSDDLYSLGVSLYFLFAGTMPGEATHSVEVTKNIKRSPQLFKLIFELLSPEPRKRPAAKEVTQRLKKLTAGSFKQSNLSKRLRKKGKFNYCDELIRLTKSKYLESERKSSNKGSTSIAFKVASRSL